MPYRNEENESDQGHQDAKTQLALIRFEQKRFRDWRAECEDPDHGWEARIRELEDFRLATETSHKTLVGWLSVAGASFSIAVNIIDHLFFKK